jgi:hypothetical protein
METNVNMIDMRLLLSIVANMPLVVIPLTYAQSAIVYRSLIDPRTAYFGPALINISFVFLAVKILYAYARGHLVPPADDPTTIQLTVGISLWATMFWYISDLRNRFPNPPRCYHAQAVLCNAVGLIGYGFFRFLFAGF